MLTRFRAWKREKRQKRLYAQAHGAFERIDAAMKDAGIPRAERRRTWREVTGNRELR